MKRTRLHKPAIERLHEGVIYDPDVIQTIFEEMARNVAEDAESGQYAVMFIGEEDDFEPGTYVPEIWFVIRKVLPDDDQAIQ